MLQVEVPHEKKVIRQQKTEQNHLQTFTTPK